MQASVRFYQSPQKRIIVPKAFRKQFQFIDEVQFGEQVSEVQCMTHQQDDHSVLVTSGLQQALNLPPVHSLLFTGSETKLKLNIPFGILTAGFRSNSRLFDTRTPFYEKMSEVGASMGFQPIFFGCQHVNASPHRIDGYIFEQGLWRKTQQMVPEIVYNRITNRKTENHPKVNQALRYLKEKTQLFNPGFFNKWEVYKHLKENTVVSHLLPETIFTPSSSVITAMLDRNPVYLKPIHGSVGKGLLRLTKNKTEEVEVNEVNQRQVQTYPTMKEFYHTQFPEGSKGYILQPQIALMEQDDRKIDYRIHTNKNEKGIWKVTVTAARLGASGHPTTHLGHGAEAKTLDELFSATKAKQVETRLHTAALRVSDALDFNYDGQLAEIGMDFGLDQDQSIWLFEANAKPGYAIFHHPSLQQDLEKNFQHLFHYSTYLFHQKALKYSNV
ncbi:YheC/YheD family endospore coat-associated protein [Thalassobacillus hwangdonensis]|uniref:YheC/YheD family protein n=1 Tax=Thalassobacillus hwangdonensis TaxID=546108 RepID=A0ABW3KXY4_9BACI